MKLPTCHTQLLVFAIWHCVTLLLLTNVSAQRPIIPTDGGRFCAVGEFDNGNACEPCPPGTFQDQPNQYFCKPCPKGTASLEHSHLSPYNPRTSCEPCSDFSFQDQEGQTDCKSCPPNTIRPLNTSAPNVQCNVCEFPLYASRYRCEVCEEGSFLQTDGSGRRSCRYCPDGTFSEFANQTSCEGCPPGTVPESKSGPCRTCRPGTFVRDGWCTPCAEGFYQPLAGTASCIPCPEGTSTQDTGSLFCLRNDQSVTCSPGQFLNNGRCEPCAAGSVSPGGTATSCFECPSPAFPDQTSPSCICPPNFQRVREQDDPYAAGGCVPCPSRSTSDGVSCQCVPPLYYETSRQKCVCPPGQRYNGESCEPCPEGVLPGEGDCDFCPRGRAVNQETGRCEFCEQRLGSGPTFDAPCECPAGLFFFTRQNRCVCVDGQFRRGAVEHIPENCIPCEADEEAIYGSCIPRCRFGQPPYNTFFDGTRCVPCGSGLQGYDGRCIPLSCPQEQFLNYRSGACECHGIMLPDGSCADCDYDLGFTSSPDSNTCVCQVGKTLIDGECIDCEAGFSTNGSGQCVPCGAKRFSPAGEWSCLFCRNGNPDIEGASACVENPCEQNEFLGLDGSCQSCGFGMRMVNRSCVECPPGSVSVGGRAAYCLACENGKTANEMRNACV